MFVCLPLRLDNPVKFSNASLLEILLAISTQTSTYHICTFLQLKHNMLFQTARAMCVAWSPDSSRIVSGGIDTNICVWDAKKGEKITMIKGT